MTTIAIPGAGCSLQFSLTGAAPYTTVAQLRKISPQNSKQTMLDQTNILTAGNGDAPLPVRFSSGEIDIDGVLSPQDSSQLTLGELHAALTRASWQIPLSDGVTVWKFQGFVSEFQPFDINVMKAVVFQARLRVWGAFTGPGAAVTI